MVMAPLYSISLYRRRRNGAPRRLTGATAGVRGLAERFPAQPAPSRQVVSVAGWDRMPNVIAARGSVAPWGVTRKRLVNCGLSQGGVVTLFCGCWGGRGAMPAPSERAGLQRQEVHRSPHDSGARWGSPAQLGEATLSRHPGVADIGKDDKEMGKRAGRGVPLYVQMEELAMDAQLLRINAYRDKAITPEEGKRAFEMLASFVQVTTELAPTFEVVKSALDSEHGIFGVKPRRKHKEAMARHDASNVIEFPAGAIGPEAA